VTPVRRAFFIIGRDRTFGQEGNVWHIEHVLLLGPHLLRQFRDECFDGALWRGLRALRKCSKAIGLFRNSRYRLALSLLPGAAQRWRLGWLFSWVNPFALIVTKIRNEAMINPSISLSVTVGWRLSLYPTVVCAARYTSCDYLTGFKSLKDS
jgi:hypothetical protein